jgi:hypothetical protein
MISVEMASIFSILIGQGFDTFFQKRICDILALSV